MVRCWDEQAEKRPGFEEVGLTISEDIIVLLLLFIADAVVPTCCTDCHGIGEHGRGCQGRS